MAAEFDTVWFLSDYGLADEFVGVVKAVIHAFAPSAKVIDLTHQIAPYDTRAGALTLARCIQYLGPGVVVGIVDPGVGSDRRAVAVEVGEDANGAESAESRRVLIGPDNGLLAPAVAMAGGARRAVALTNRDYQLDAPGPTFAGRDIFGPAAAHLCAGVDLADLGEEVDPLSLIPGVVPLPRQEDERVAGEVLWVDRFGNAQLNVGPEELASMGDHLTLRCHEQTRSAALVGSYSDLKAGQIGLMVDAYGLMAVVQQRRSAAEELGLVAGDSVTVEAAV
ncbi:MAG: SAM hydrolase/SAM-dependent halogenase family protein [Acidimicrobiales bacterium]